MSLDLTAAVEAAARAWRDENTRRFPAFAVEWDDLPAGTRRNDLAVMTAALAAAAPLIAAQVRAQVAAEIEAYTDAVLDLVDTQNGARLAFEEIARIARDGRP